MESLHRFAAVLRADLLERVRSVRFWFVIAATVGLTWLCFPPADAHYIVVGINTNHRGTYSSAWTGMVLAMLSIWSSLVGFYLVRGNLRRDIDTRVWELLEVTPLGRYTYLAAKWSSHMLVLGGVLAAQMGVGLAAQLIRAEDTSVDLAQLWVPALVLGLPSLALTAMFAIWFDMLPWLRRSAGNYVYFALWLAILLATVRTLAPAAAQAAAAPAAIAVQQPADWFSDPRGLTLFHRALHQRLEGKLEAPLAVCVGCIFPSKRSVVRFDWPAWHIEPAQLLGRLFWLALALGGVLLAAPWLDRVAVYGRTREQGTAGSMARRRTPLLDLLMQPLRRSRFGTLLAADLVLALGRRNLWWWLGAWSVAAAQVFVPLRFVGVAVIVAWLLLIDIYAGAVLREREARAGAVVFSAAHALRNVFAARWLVMVMLGGLLALPATLRLGGVMPAAALAIAAVCLSLPTWSMALGAVTGNSRSAEMALCVLAYLGVQGMALLNVVVAPGWTASVHLALLPVAALLAWVAWPRLQHAPV
ncbi:MAG: hypothetical protein EOO78_05860 [Oxalobacteraceae bacterium]|nr:MAG: hypothetical protein EOO78_05860 [Oxalobacteraceae bacterium]